MKNQAQIHPTINKKPSQQDDPIQPVDQPIKSPKKRRNSLMIYPMKKFAAQQFEQKAIVLCQFCGGQTCKQQDYRTNKIQPNAIQGLHSNWITANILAMQRPSDRLIKQYGLYDKFKKQKINTILNLQQPGQHPYCGDGLLSMVGFSYNPEGFFKQGIKFFNESWEDMTATTFQHMMRIMDVFYVSLVKQNGKISVHCHAGRGRTLLVICSWLIYHDRMSAQETIDLAVEKRQGVLTRTSQREFLKDFQQQLKFRWKTYGPITRKSFTQFVQFQKISLLKHQQSACKYKPYIHYKILQQLKRRYQMHPQNNRQIIMSFVNCQSEYFKQKWNNQHQIQLKSFKHKINNHTLFNKQSALIKQVDVRILTQLLYDFYDGLPFTLLSAINLQYLIKFVQNGNKQENIMQQKKNGNNNTNNNNNNNNSKLNALLQPQFVHETGVQAIIVMLDLVYFIKCLIKNTLNLTKQNQDVQILDCLFIRLAILLSGKRKYSPKIFPINTQKHYRKCRLLKYDSKKRQQYTSLDQIKLADFLQKLALQLSDDQTEIDNFITKIRKIDSNLHYFTKSHQSQGNDGFIEKQKAKEIYDKSRI